MMFVGTMGADNARERVDGIKKSLSGSKVEIVDIRTDEVDFARAKRNVEDTLTKYPNIDLLSGLYSYNTPQIVEAVRAAGKSGQVKVIGFDEDPVTLRGIADGIVDATVVQQPFEFGYQSMKLLAQVIEGNKSNIPANGLDIIPTRVIDSSNVADFQKTALRKYGSLKRVSRPRPGRPAPAGPLSLLRAADDARPCSHSSSRSSSSRTSARPTRASPRSPG